MQAHVYFNLHFDISNLRCLPFQKLHTEKLRALQKKQCERTEVEGVRATCVCKCTETERDVLILQEPNQKYYSFTYLIIQTELGIISPHVIYLSTKTLRKK